LARQIIEPAADGRNLGGEGKPAGMNETGGARDVVEEPGGAAAAPRAQRLLPET
jgi:hypothetical protein